MALLTPWRGSDGPGRRDPNGVRITRKYRRVSEAINHDSFTGTADVVIDISGRTTPLSVLSRQALSDCLECPFPLCKQKFVARGGIINHLRHKHQIEWTANGYAYEVTL